MTRSPQMTSLMARYEVTTKVALLRAIRDEYNEECVDPGEEPFTIADAELMLDGMLDAEYQKLDAAAAATEQALHGRDQNGEGYGWDSADALSGDVLETVECACGGGLVYPVDRELNEEHVHTARHINWVLGASEPTPKQRIARCKHRHLTTGRRCSSHVTEGSPDYCYPHGYGDPCRGCNETKKETPVTTQTLDIPTTITCRFDVSGPNAYRSRGCGLPAVLVLQSFDFAREVTYSGRCKRHASVDKRRTYSQGTIVEFTPEIVEAIVAEQARIDAIRAEERTRKNEEAEKQHAAYKVSRAAEAATEYIVTRKDEQGDPDWNATRTSDGEMVYGPSVPKWYAHSVNEEPGRGWHEASAKVERKADFPTTIELRASSSLDIAQAEALIEALTLAVAEAKLS